MHPRGVGGGREEGERGEGRGERGEGDHALKKTTTRKERLSKQTVGKCSKEVLFLQ